MEKMWKTKRYYKQCLAMQISNNKMLNNKLIDERKDHDNFKLEHENLTNIAISEQKKEIKSLKSKNTRLTNEIKKLKGED